MIRVGTLFGIRNERRRDVGAWQCTLSASLKELDRILTKNGLSARITVENETVTIGDLRDSTERAGFRFVSYAAFRKAIEQLSLYSIARAYIGCRMDLEGPPSKAIEILYAINMDTDRARTITERLGSLAFRISKAVLPPIAKQFESDAHYSMTSDAYELFLDKRMQYTCGKFITGLETIDECQQNKFDLIARIATDHLGPLKGLKHLDLGCGWGGLIGYFQERYETVSLGNTNNVAQALYARERFSANVSLGDFTSIAFGSSQFDLVTVIGMAEHLTPSRRTKLLRKIHCLLRPGGVLYFQCIARPNVWIGGDAYRIAYQDVFPGHYLEAQHEMEKKFSAIGFEIVYSIDDAEDYSKTTAIWAKRIEQKRNDLVRIVGETNYRIFYGYLSYASKLFASNRGSLMRYCLRKIS